MDAPLGDVVPKEPMVLMQGVWDEEDGRASPVEAVLTKWHDNVNTVQMPSFADFRKLRSVLWIALLRRFVSLR